MSFRSIIPAALLVAATLAGACASSGAKGSTADGGCALRPQDSTFAMHMPLYRDCAVEKKAVLLTTGISPDYRPTNTANSCFSAELEYVVTAEGRPDPTTAKVVRTNTPAFAEAVLAILPRFRFDPAKREGVAVAQIVSEKFAMQVRRVVVPAGTRPSPGARAPRTSPGC